MADRGRMVTIAQVVLSLNVGGLESIVVSLLKHVDRNRFRSVLYCLEEPGVLFPEVRDFCDAVSIFHKQRGLAYAMPLRMARLMKRHNVDIVHCHNFSPLVYGSIAGRLARLRGIVYTAHGPETSGRREQRVFQRLKLVDRIVVISNHVRQKAIEEGGLDPRRVVGIPNGIDVAAYSNGSDADRDAVRAGMGVTPDEPLIGVVARLSPEKNHAMLLDAFALLVKDQPAVRLAIVGDGESRDSLVAKTRTLGIEKRVMFLGRRDDIPKLLKAFDLFALSSRWEGLGLTLLEAMAAGLATVATEVGGIPEVVVHGETGLLVPSNDPVRFAEALAQLIDDRAAAREMGRRGYRRAREQFGLDDMVTKYESLYEELAARRE